MNQDVETVLDLLNEAIKVLENLAVEEPDEFHRCLELAKELKEEVEYAA